MTAREAAYSGMRPLSGVLEQQQGMVSMRRASLDEAAEPEPEHLYSIGKDGAVIAHDVVRKTGKTIWYSLPGRWYWPREWMETTLPDGTIGTELRYTGKREWDQPEPEQTQRRRLERDGMACKCFTHGTVRYCHAGFGGKTIPQSHYLYTSRETAEAFARGDIKALRRQMAGAHPDRGGTNEQFMAARKRYEWALKQAS